MSLTADIARFATLVLRSDDEYRGVEFADWDVFELSLGGHGSDALFADVG